MTVCSSPRKCYDVTDVDISENLSWTLEPVNQEILSYENPEEEESRMLME